MKLHQIGIDLTQEAATLSLESKTLLVVQVSISLSKGLKPYPC